MAGEAAIDAQAVARHLLGQAAIASPRGADGAFVAGHNGWHYYLLTHQFVVTSHHHAAYLMSQSEGGLTYCGNTEIEVAEVGMADAAARHLYQSLPLLK